MPSLLIRNCIKKAGISLHRLDFLAMPLSLFCAEANQVTSGHARTILTSITEEACVA